MFYKMILGYQQLFNVLKTNRLFFHPNFLQTYTRIKK